MKKLFLSLTLLLVTTTAYATDFGITISVNKAGEVITTSSPNCPATTLAADGSLISRAAYPRLFLAIGTAYGEGDSSTTFALPDYRGQFLRSAGAIADPDFGSRLQLTFPNSTNDNKVGSFQGDVFSAHNHGGGNHYHPFGHYNWYYFNQGSQTAWGDFGGGPYSYSNTNYSGTIINTEGGNETRPRNISVQRCIAY